MEAEPSPVITSKVIGRVGITLGSTLAVIAFQTELGSASWVPSSETLTPSAFEDSPRAGDGF